MTTFLITYVFAVFHFHHLVWGLRIRYSKIDFIALRIVSALFVPAAQ